MGWLAELKSAKRPEEPTKWASWHPIFVPLYAYVEKPNSESIDIGRMRKMPPAIRYGIDALLILVPLVVMTYFLFDPAAFNAFTAWLARVL